MSRESSISAIAPSCVSLTPQIVIAFYLVLPRAAPRGTRRPSVVGTSISQSSATVRVAHLKSPCCPKEDFLFAEEPLGGNTSAAALFDQPVGFDNGTRL